MPVGDYSELGDFRGDLPAPTTPPTPASPFIPKAIIDAAGDLIVGAADNTPERLAPGTNAQVLTMVAGVPAWAAGGGAGGGSILTAIGLDATPSRVVRATNLNAFAGWTVGTACVFNDVHYRFPTNISNTVWRTRSKDGQQWELPVRVYYNSSASVRNYMTAIGVQSFTKIGTTSGNIINTTTPHKLTQGQIISFYQLSGATGLVSGVDYYVRTISDSDSFTVAATAALSSDVVITGAYTIANFIAAYFWGVLDSHDASANGTYAHSSQTVMRSLDNGLTWAAWQAMPNGTGLTPLTGTPNDPAAKVPDGFTGLVQIGTDTMGALWSYEYDDAVGPLPGFVTWDHLSDANGSSATFTSVQIGTVSDRGADAQAWTDGAGNVVIPLRYDASLASATTCKVAVSNDSGATWKVGTLSTPADDFLSGSGLGIGLTPDGTQFVIVGFHRYDNGGGNGEIYFWVGDKTPVLAAAAGAIGALFTRSIVGNIGGQVIAARSSAPSGQGGFTTVGDRMVLAFSAPTDLPAQSLNADLYAVSMDFGVSRVEGPIITRADIWDARPADVLAFPNYADAADLNMFLGAGAGNTTNTAAVRNTGVGVGALNMLTTGDNNTAFGYTALSNLTTPNQNTAFGSGALAVVVGGNANTAVGAGSLTDCIGGDNVGMGVQTGLICTSGVRNTFLGPYAGYNSTTTGADNVLIGYNAQASGAATTFEVAIGSGAVGSGNNTITLGRAAGTDTVIIPGVTSIVGATNPGQIRFYEGSSGGGGGDNYTGFKAPGLVASSNPVYQLPNDYPASDKVLQSNSSGVLSWVTGSSGLTVGTTPIASGTDTFVLFQDGTSLGEDSGLTFDKNTNDLGVGGKMTSTTASIGTLTVTTAVDFSGVSGVVDISPDSPGGIDNMVIGGITPKPGTFTNITLSGDQSAAAWTTSGLRLKGITGTLTDTSSSGTVAAAYTNKLGGNTIAATNATTFTNYISLYASEPVQGTNVTLTNKWALGADSLYIGTSNPFKVTSAGAVTMASTAAVTGTLTLGDGASATAILASNLSGATDPTITFANALITTSSSFAITGGGTFTTSLISTTALATPSALAATQFTGFASTVSGAAIMGFGTTNDVALMNRAGTVCLGVGPNTTLVNIPGTLNVGSSRLVVFTGSGSGGNGAVWNATTACTTCIVGLNNSGETIGTLSKYLVLSRGQDTTATVFLSNEADATLKLGQDGAGTAAQGAQVIKGPDRITSDGVGANVTIAGGRNRGANAGGSVILQTSAPAAATVTGTLANREYVYGGEKTLTESSATIVANITLAAGTYIGGEIIATTHADDATDFQSITDVLVFAAVNKGGTVTATISAPTTSTTAASSVATLATTWTIVANGNSVDIKNSAVSSLTQTTLACSWQLRLNGNAAQVVTP